MYRMAVLALCSSDAKLDIAKCVMLCIVHDLAEAQGIIKQNILYELFILLHSG
jgi:hypothetical protein